MGTILLFIWAFCLLCQTFLNKLELVFDRFFAAFTLLLLLSILLLCIQPFKAFYKRGRLSLLSTLWNIVISPFGQVKFKHFFLADVLTSMAQPLRDLGYVGCFFFQGGWLEKREPTVDSCPHLQNYLLVIVFFPFWFRMA